MRSLINAKISGFRLWIIPEPLVPRQEDRRLGERDCVFACSQYDVTPVPEGIFAPVFCTSRKN